MVASGMYPNAMGTVAADRNLYNVEGTARKQYQVTLAEAPGGGWMVIGSWGPIGRVTQHKVYARTDDATAAVSAANVLIHGKLKRGYDYDPDGPAGHIRVSEVIAERMAEAVSALEERPAASLADALFAWMTRPGIWQGRITQPGDPAGYAAMQPLCVLDRSDGARIEVALDVQGDTRRLIAVGDEWYGRLHCAMECPLPDDEQVARQATRFIRETQADDFHPMAAWRSRVTAADIRGAVDAAGGHTPARLRHGDAPVRTLSEALFD